MLFDRPRCPQMAIIGRNLFPASSRVRELSCLGGRKPPKPQIHLVRIGAERAGWPNDISILRKRTDAWRKPVRRWRRCGPAPPVLARYPGEATAAGCGGITLAPVRGSGSCRVHAAFPHGCGRMHPAFIAPVTSGNLSAGRQILAALWLLARLRTPLRGK